MSLWLIEKQNQGSQHVSKRKRMDFVPSATRPAAAECAQECVTVTLSLHAQDPEGKMGHGHAKL